MSDLFRFIETLKQFMFCGIVLAFAFVATQALPQGRLKAFLATFIKWAFAGLCLAYAYVDLDFMPQALFGSTIGLLDDAAAGMAGLLAIISAVKDHQAKVRTKRKVDESASNSWPDEWFDL